MSKTNVVLTRLRRICLSLPETVETITWGKPVIGFKLQMAHAEMIIDDDRFWRAPYVGHKGWVSMDATRVNDWERLRSMILESYELIAPKKILAKLESKAPSAAKTATKKRAASRTRPRATMPRHATSTDE